MEVAEIELTEVETSSLPPTPNKDSLLDKTKQLRAHSIASLPEEYVAKFQAIRVKRNASLKESVLFLCLRYVGMRQVEGDFVRSFGAIHPESSFAMTWNSIHGLILFFLAIFAPLQAAFPVETCNDGMSVFNDAIDLFFILDVILNFFIGYKKPGEHGLYVDNFRKIAKRYIRSGDFFFDFFLSIPVSWIQMALYPTCNAEFNTAQTSRFLMVPRILRLFRLLRVLRVIRLFRMFFFSYISSNHFVLKILKVVTTMVVLMHMTACCFWLVKSTSDDNLEIWKVDQNLVGGSMGDFYTASLYFAVATLVTIGYGDIHATNTTERSFMLVVMLIGAAAFATLISNISSMVASTTSKDTKHQEKISQVKEFVKYWKVPRDLAGKIEEFYQYNNEVAPWKTNLEMMKELPALLRTELCSTLANQLVGKVKFFEGAPEEYIALIFLALRPFRCAPGEMIMVEGQQGGEMFIIVRGEVKTILSNGVTVEVLKPGDVFGESAVIYRHERRSVNAVATKFCELMLLSVSDVDAANFQFPEMAAKMESVAKERWSRMQKSRKASIYGNKALQMIREADLLNSAGGPSTGNNFASIASSKISHFSSEGNGNHVPLSVTHNRISSGLSIDGDGDSSDDGSEYSEALEVDPENAIDDGAGVSADPEKFKPKKDGGESRRRISIVSEGVQNDENYERAASLVQPTATPGLTANSVPPQKFGIPPPPPPAPLWQGDKFVAPASWLSPHSSSSTPHRGGQSLGDGFDRNILLNDMRQRRASIQLASRIASTQNERPLSSKGSGRGPLASLAEDAKPRHAPPPIDSRRPLLDSSGFLSPPMSPVTLDPAPIPVPGRKRSLTLTNAPLAFRNERPRSVTVTAKPAPILGIQRIEPTLPVAAAFPSVDSGASAGDTGEDVSPNPSVLHLDEIAPTPPLNDTDSLEPTQTAKIENDSWGPRVRVKNHSVTVPPTPSPDNIVSKQIEEESRGAETENTQPQIAEIDWDRQTCDEIREMAKMIHTALEAMELREMAKLVDNVRALGSTPEELANKNKMQQLAYKALSGSQRLQALISTREK